AQQAEDDAELLQRAPRLLRPSKPRCPSGWKGPGPVVEVGELVALLRRQLLRRALAHEPIDRDQGRADRFVAVVGLTLHAREALAGIDGAVGTYGARLAASRADLTVFAEAAAIGPRRPERAGQSQRRTERTQIATERAIPDQGYGGESEPPRDEQPLAGPGRDEEGGLERFDLRQRLTELRRVHEGADQPRQDQVPQVAQPAVRPIGQLELGQPHQPSQAKEELVEGAVRAGPAAEDAAPPDHDDQGDEDPCHEQHWLAQEQAPAPAAERTVDEREQLRDRRLRAQHQAEE